MSLRDAADGFGGFVLETRSERHALAADKLPLILSEWNNTPAINKYTVSAEGGVLRLDAMLDMLEVRLIEIKRLP